MLCELGETSSPIIYDAVELIFSLWREDGRFQIAPEGAIYPCHTANVARVLCRLNYLKDNFYSCIRGFFSLPALNMPLPPIGNQNEKLALMYNA